MMNCSNCLRNQGTKYDIECGNMFCPFPDDYCSRWFPLLEDFFAEKEREKLVLRLYGRNSWRYGVKE